MVEYDNGKIFEIVSGGQAGADISGLAVGKDLSLKTSGMAPKGFKTKWGPEPRLKKLGLIESLSEDYRPRTYYNVEHSDGTIRFAYDFMTGGELCTLKAIKKYNKPFIDVDLKDLEDGNFLLFDVLDWFKENDIRVLNVAGNGGDTKHQSSKIFSLVRKNLKVWISKYNEGY